MSGSFYSLGSDWYHKLHDNKSKNPTLNLILYAYSQTSQLYATLQCSRFSHIFILVVDIYNYFSWIMIAL